MTAPQGGLVDSLGALHDVEYPVSDGVPLGETDRHRDELVHYAVDVLARHFRDAGDVYVSGNNFLYYERGDPQAVVSPDTYVVRGVAPHLRDTFKVWEEGGHRPCFVLEITSRTTRQADLGEKMSRYRDDLEVPEYFLFDPRRDWIPDALRGFQRESGAGGAVYTPIPPGAAGRLVSRQLGLELGVVDRHLRFFVPGAAAPLPTHAERAERVEQELAQVKAELERLRGGGGLSAP